MPQKEFLNFAMERDIIPASPCLAVKAVAKENRRDRVLSVEEIKTVWIALSKNEKLENGKAAIQMSLSSRLALKFQLVTAIYDRHSYDAEKKYAMEVCGSKLREITENRAFSDNVLELKKVV